MVFPKEKLLEISATIDSITDNISQFEKTYQSQINNVHPNYTKSAKNLIHYLALRSFDVDLLQGKLADIGFPTSLESRSSILYNLYYFKTIIGSLLKMEMTNGQLFLTNKEAKTLQSKNSEALFGTLKNNRKTGIMVTQPEEAANDVEFASSLLNLGMDCARINCAHDNEVAWKQMIDNIRASGLACKIMMDLGGPKIRTGKMKPGEKVIRIKPKTNSLGQVIAPAKIWLAPFGIKPPKGEKADAIIPVNKKWLRKTDKGSYIIFRDSRGKKRKIRIDKKEENGRWGSCGKSAFLTTGMLLTVYFDKKSTSEEHSVHEILPLEEVIFLFEGDLLRLDKEPILGEPAVHGEGDDGFKMAHISCTLPEALENVKVGEPILFNDGKIEGVVNDVQSDHIIVKITNAKKRGGKLRADKGINLPDSKLGFGGLTDKDKTDLKFIVKHADAVNFSFVNNKQDVQDLLNELKKLNAEIGIVLKIETQEAFENLPGILLKAMEIYPVGVMIARGDLAIETGWKNFAIIQEEILQLCDAAHLPDIWATQVLDNLAKKGIPTRAEITDAAMAQRTKCVMLNKGPYIAETVKMLDKILGKMQRIQGNKGRLLPKLEFDETL